MSVKENKAIARRFNDEYLNKKNLAIIDELLDANYVGHPGMTSREQFKENAKRSLAAFPESSITIEDMIAEGDTVVFRWTVFLTHTKEVMGVAPTGKQLRRTGISIYRIVDGKIVEDWYSADDLGVWKQFGSAPDMDQVKESSWD